MPQTRKFQLLLIAVTTAVLAPFLHKAFHIDDPLFIWMAQQITRHPLDPYGFMVDWATFPQPAFEQIQNPPLCSYYMAGIGSMFGWSEVALHLGFLFWAIAAILGTFRIVQCLDGAGEKSMQYRVAGGEIGKAAFIAGLLTLFTPAFLVSATNVMSDVMLLALWLWSTAFWLEGLERNRWSLLFLAAVGVGFATLTKYFGIALVPLLAAITLSKLWERRGSGTAHSFHWSCVFLLFIPVAAAIAYDLWTKSKYGRGLFSDATFYSHQVGAASGDSLTAHFFTGLSFLGGCLVVPLFFAWPSGRRFWLAAGVPASIGAAGFIWALPVNSAWQLGGNETWVRTEGAIFAAIGAITLARACAEVVRGIGIPLLTRPWKPDGDKLLVGFWILGTFVFATFLNWSITARTFLPLVPAVAISLKDGLNRRYWWGVPIAGLLALLIAFADYSQADSARVAAATFQRRFQGQHLTVWFQSHWGFQYYMQSWGAVPLNTRDSEITGGDVMIVPANNTAVSAIPPERIFTPEEETFSVFPFVSTMGLGTGAGLYSSIRGPIPWAIDRTRPELYYVARFR